MKNIFNYSLAILLLSLGSCKKESSKNCDSDYLIFGHFYGMCFGETCMETYKLTEGNLYEDQLDNYFGEGPFDFEELPQAKYNLVEDLPDYIPQSLIVLPDSTIGCPDCVDQGGIYIEYAHDGIIQKWRIDQSPPAYLEDFVDKVNEKIALINQ